MNDLVKYWINRDDIIIRTNFAYDNFAQENGGDDITSDNIVGKSLFRYINGDSAKMFTRTIFERVRLIEKDLSREYRCDSPSVKRYMKMHIQPSDNSGLVVTHELIKEVKFERPVGFLLSNGGKYFKRCSMCNKIEFNTRWFEPDHQLLKDKLTPLNQVIYTICGHCKVSHS